MERKTVLTAVVLLGLLCAAVAQGGIAISTAYGSGADTFVGNDSKTSSTATKGTATALESRYNGGGSRFTATYLRFDISQETGSFAGTTLSLTATALKGTTGRRLDVYGLVDETLDSWDESTTCYQNAPGMLQPASGWNMGDYAIDSTKLTWLGYFICPAASVPVPAVFNTDPALLDLGSFLNADTNNLATVVIINATGTSGVNSENKFGSKENTTSGVYAPALITPEPATMLILGLGSLMVIRRKRG